jgi:ribosome-binding protein aMBF1 (putative translation factor)
MGHYCRICGRERANEKFSGKGHQIHVCKDCMRLPQEERQAAEEEQEIWGYLSQSNISAKNLSRLKKLATSPNEEIAGMARLVLESRRHSYGIGRVHPQKRNRLRFMARKRKDPLDQLEETGLILACQ